MAVEPTTPDVVKLYAVIGERVARERGRKGMSQEELAAQIGVSRASITQAESGQQRLPLQSLYLIAAVLGVAITALLPTVDDLSSTQGQDDIVARVNNDTTLSDDGRDALKAFFTKVNSERGRS
jgi:transcriptional regulator with XRE-family HTH domain